MASTSLADPNLPTAVAADQAGISGNQAQSRDPHAREGLTCDGQLDWSKLKISDPPVRPPYLWPRRGRRPTPHRTHGSNSQQYSIHTILRSYRGPPESLRSVPICELVAQNHH